VAAAVLARDNGVVAERPDLVSRPSSSSLADSLSLRAVAEGSFAPDGLSGSVGETGSLVLRWARRLTEQVLLLRYRRQQKHEVCS
jgi:hypothetical protein